MAREERVSGHSKTKDTNHEQSSDEYGTASELSPSGIPIRFLGPLSGLYRFKGAIHPPFPVPLPTPVPPIPIPFTGDQGEATSEASGEREASPVVPTDAPGSLFDQEILRLDVDGRYPQMMASGVIMRFRTLPLHWIARVKKTSLDTWAGEIWYKDGNASLLPHTTVWIRVIGGPFASSRNAVVTFKGAGLSSRTRVLRFESPYFHPVDFECDCAEGVQTVTSIQTHDHPNRPATLPSETLSIETVFRRAGFGVTDSPGDPVPLLGAGPNARWSDAEMHDAMQTYWSHFANTAQWGMWVFFASLHEMGTNLGGVMFDDIGPNHRQGTALFLDSFIKNPPPNDPAPNAWVRRMQFWTACHEMGHAFNLAHSWQKSLGTPWIPLQNRPEDRSFMNYPYNVSGGQSAFFADFGFRFSDEELLFMRHAPSRFVQMGNAAWFDHHGFQEGNILEEPSFRLEVRVNRKVEPANVLEFLEPLTVELKLTNLTNQPKVLDYSLLKSMEQLTVITKKDRQPAKQLLPFARHCWSPGQVVVEPGESIYESLFVSVGNGGWGVDEPGYYTIQASVRIGEEDVVSNRLRIKVEPPMNRAEESLAQDYFGDDVGRILSLDGSAMLQKGNDTLQTLVTTLKDRRAAVHARVALGMAATHRYKRIVIPANGNGRVSSLGQIKARIKVETPHAAEFGAMLSPALGEEKTMGKSADTLGHIDFKYYVDAYTEALAAHGDLNQAASIQQKMHALLKDRGVLPSVLTEVSDRAEHYKHIKGKESLAPTAAKSAEMKMPPVPYAVVRNISKAARPRAAQ